MNSVYFSCKRCCEYIDAGYRWAYWKLESPGIVVKGQLIDVERVLRASTYWEITQGSWLDQLMPLVMNFLTTHQDHGIIYGKAEGFLDLDNPSYFDWLEVGNDAAEVSPRSLFYQAGLKNWHEVEAWTASNPSHCPWWWYDELLKGRAQHKFDLIAEA